MVIINPTSIIQPAAVNRPAGPAPVIPTDKVLMAQVMGQRANHLYELASGNLRLMAESKTPLRTGEQLLLQYRGADPQNRPVLQVMGKPSAALAPILREILPKQQAINHLVASASQALRQGGSPALTKIVQEFISQLPNRSQFSQPEALKTILQNSGLFFEHGLKSGSSTTNDLKAALLRLASQLQALSTTTSTPPATKLTQHAPLPSEYGGANAKAPTTAAPQQLSVELKLPAQAGALFNPLPKRQQAPTTIADQATKSAIFSQPAGKPTATLNANQPTAGAHTTSSATSTSSAATPPTANPAPAIAPSQLSGGAATQLSMAAKSAYSGAIHHASNLPGQAAAQARLELSSGTQFSRGEQLASQLLQETKGALFRQEAHQLLHLQQRELHPQQYIMEIPVRERDGIDVWQLQLSAEPRDDESKQQDKKDAGIDTVKGWKIVLNFDLPGLGAMSANIRDRDGHLDINIRSKIPQTDSLVKMHQAELREKLAQQGVSDVDIKSHCGEAEEQDSPLQYYNLLSTKA